MPTDKHNNEVTNIIKEKKRVFFLLVYLQL